MYKGLSTDQAPPISVPFRFFITAPFFAILIGLIFINYPLDSIFNRYSNIAIAVTHIFTLGVLSMLIIGAMLQMLPVLAGVVIKNSIIFANVVHISLTIGTLGLSGGFLFESNLALSIGGLFLVIAFFTFFFTIIKSLFKVTYITSTVNGMKFFSIGGLITILLGIFLIYSHIEGDILSFHYNIVNIHIIFARFGFAFILVMAISFQVIPMFYVARDFPKSLQDKFPRVILGMLFLFTIFTILSLNTQPIKEILAILLIIFAYYAPVSLNNRRRPVFDVTLWYWKFSLYSLIISQILFLFFDNIIVLTLVFIFGFLYPLLQGMIYKIIPFLAWFHLSSNGYFSIPNLREYIKEDMIKLQFHIYMGSFLFFILSSFFNQLFLYIAATLFLLSNLLFLFNLIVAIKKYYDIDKTNPMDAFKVK